LSPISCFIGLIHVFWLNMSFFVIDFVMSDEEVWPWSYCPSTLNAESVAILFHNIICCWFFMNYLWICFIDLFCCCIVHSKIFHITVFKIYFCRLFHVLLVSINWETCLSLLLILWCLMFFFWFKDLPYYSFKNIFFWPIACCWLLINIAFPYFFH